MSDVPLNSCGLPLLSSERSWRADEEFKKRQQAREETRRREEEQRAVAASNNWYAMIDARLEQHFFSGDLGVGGVLKDAIGEALGKKARQVRDEFKCAIEEMRCALEAKLAALEQRQAASVSLVDGRIEAAIAHGRDVLLEASGGTRELRAEVKHSFEEMCSAFGAQLAELEERLKRAPGRLPVAKIWHEESVTYEGEVVGFDGSLYQARKDTAQMPGGSDWVCVARGGRDGCDGLTLNLRGRFEGYKKYQRLDVIEFDGSSFVALHDDPGIPGDAGWQLLCRPGSRGPVGDVGLRGRKGERGARGADAPTIVSWTLDRKNYRAVPTMSNGQAGAPLDLRGLFEQYMLETTAATP